MAIIMYSRTSALFLIVCTSVSWNVKATTGVASTEGRLYAAASMRTENLPPDTPSVTVEEATVYPLLNSSFNSTVSASTEHSTHLSLVKTSVPVQNSPETGSATASTTLHSSSTVQETRHINSTVNASTTLHVSSTAQETGHINSTVNASTTLHVSSTAQETGHINSTVNASTTLHSSVTTSKAGQLSSTVSNSNTTKTTLPTQESLTPQFNATTLSVETNSTLVSDKTGNGMNYSEAVLTSIFSTILVVVLLTSLAFCFNKYRKQRSQYSHHPLHENIYESDGYTPPDDTLVISGGLYDAPRIYNPNMTVLEEEDSQPDYISFSNRAGQFRLEFLPGDNDMDPGYNGSLRRNV